MFSNGGWLLRQKEKIKLPITDTDLFTSLTESELQYENEKRDIGRENTPSF